MESKVVTRHLSEKKATRQQGDKATRRGGGLAAGLVLAVWCAVPLLAQQPDDIRLFVGRSTIIDAPWPVKTVSVTEPKIADLEALRANKVLVLGKSPGATDVVLLGEGNSDVWLARVVVDVDVRRIEADLANLFPGQGLQARQSEGIVLVSGRLGCSNQAEQLRNYLTTTGVRFVDSTSVSGVQQVQVQVRIAEASRNALRALGINALMAGHNDNTFFGASQVGTANGGALNPVSIGPLAGSVAGPEHVPFAFTADVSVSPLVTLLAGFPRADLEFFIQALAENTYLRVLAEPNLIALNGEVASFLAGGEFPIPVVQSGISGGNSITIEYKEFGVRLNFRPTVLGDNQIRIHVAPEVSSLTDQGAVEIQGFRVPALITRRAETTVELKSGQSFAMAGLLHETDIGRNSRVPGLGDLPVLGALFRSVRYERGETELLVLVTACLVEPTTLEECPPLPGDMHVPPNDWELYLCGRIEGRPPCVARPDAVRMEAAGLDRLRGPGAWVWHDSPPCDSAAPVGANCPAETPQ
jgi:pilus assembly protein CpaC